MKVEMLKANSTREMNGVLKSFFKGVTKVIAMTQSESLDHESLEHYLHVTVVFE